MAIMESINFSYAGKYSSDFGIYNVSMSSGLYEETFMGSRSISETKVVGSSKPIFHRIEQEPLKFKLTFAFKDTWDDKLIREVARWLNQSYYKPLFFSEQPDRIFYCLPVDDISLIHNGLKQGYLSITMRCDSHYSYTPIVKSPVYDFSRTEQEKVITINNYGDLVCKPEVFVTKIGNGDITIRNLSNLGEEFKFTGLLDGESLYIDCDREHIETSLVNTYRYDNFNNKYIRLPENTECYLEVEGSAQIQFRYQLKVLQ